MTVSIIIAVKKWQRNLEECLIKCGQLNFKDFEILVLADDPAGEKCGISATIPLKVIPTGPLGPAHKRDMAIGYAGGEILAFIDDDAYPDKDWLNSALVNFKDLNVAAVGGPAVTPQGDSLMQKASGQVYASFIVSAGFVYRYLPKSKRFVDDYPSCNFLVRKSVMLELGGFDTNFWPGEDTKLCLEITGKLGKKIVYDPAVLVYHHRRPLFLPHIKQVANYALHRGYFVKRFPATSRRIGYFIPSLFLISLATGAILSIIFAYFRALYSAALLLYLGLVSIFSICAGLRTAVLVFFGIIFTHLTYGLFFLKGLTSGELKEGR